MGLYNCFDLKAQNDLMAYYNKNYKTENSQNFIGKGKNEEINFSEKDNLLEKLEEENNKFNIACLNSNEIFVIDNSQNSLNNSFSPKKISLKIKNTGKKTLPKLCYLECTSSSSEISGKTVQINIPLKPGMTINTEISLDVKNLKPGIYLSIWKMQ